MMEWMLNDLNCIVFQYDYIVYIHNWVVYDIDIDIDKIVFSL